MAPYIKWKVVFGAILMIALIVCIAGCMNAAPKVNSGNSSTSIMPPVAPQSSTSIMPPVAPQTPTATPTPVSQDTRISAPHVITEPKQTVYNSPENGPRMPDLPAYKGPLPTITPSVTPTPKPTATPIIIR